MENGFLSIKEVLKQMQIQDSNGEFVRFDISYRTFNGTTKQGGALKKYENVKYLPSPADQSQSLKNPSHFENRTRNIELSDGSVRTVRVDFIIMFNNCKVIY